MTTGYCLHLLFGRIKNDDQTGIHAMQLDLRIFALNIMGNYLEEGDNEDDWQQMSKNERVNTKIVEMVANHGEHEGIL